jgi:hypothetical protein
VWPKSRIAAEAAPAKALQARTMFGIETELTVSRRRLAYAVGSFLQNPLVDLFAVNLDIMRRFDADSNLVTLDPQNGDCDVITDDKFLPYSSCQYQHNNLPLVSDTSCIRAFIVFYAYAKTICETFK